MYTIIPLLLAHIQELNNQILFLFNFIVKNIPLKAKPHYDCYSPKYNKLKVDKLPILNTPVKKKNFKILLDEYFISNGKALNPVKHRSKNAVPSSIICPCCDAPSDYIYDNTGGRGQFLCKVCNTHFNQNNYASLHFGFCCPHCSKPLSTKKERKHFIIHRCRLNKTNLRLRLELSYV